MSTQCFDLTGQVFGRLTVVSRLLNDSNGSRWLCRCSCGKTHTVLGSNLLGAGVKSCGCLRKNSPKYALRKPQDLTGQVFNRLTVVSKAPTEIAPCGKKLYRWFCRCSCGRDHVAIASHLVSGIVKSCGCLVKETSSLNNYRHGGLAKNSPVDYKVKFKCLKSIRTRAQHRGYETDLSIEDLPELGDVCPVLGLPFAKMKGKSHRNASPSIDRKNPNLPYLKKYKDNLRFISMRANWLKSNATIDELRKIIIYMSEENI